MSVKMTHYKHADFEDDMSSIGSVQLTEGISTTTTHIRYHAGGRCLLLEQGMALWRARTTLEKVLICFILFCWILIIIPLCVLTSSAGKPTTKEVLHVSTATNFSDAEMPCLKPNCVKAAASILTALDPSIDPCVDFYEYACGSWMRSNPIPDGKAMWGAFGKLEQQNQQVIKNALEKDYDSMKSKAEKKAKRYYTSCIDANETMEALGAKPLLDLLKDAGGWNISTPNWNASGWKLQTTLHYFHNNLNMGGLFSWTVGEDDKNSSRNILQIDQGGLTLPTRDNYLNKTENGKLLSAYLDYMTTVGVLLGGEKNTTRAQMQAVIDFETKLANITEPPESRRDDEKLYNLVPLSDINKLAPFISWVEYFSDAMHVIDRKATAKEMVVLYAPKYLENLNGLIEEHLNTTEGRVVLNNYIVWQTVRSLTSALSKPFRDAYRGLRKALMGSESGEDPWRFCVTDTNQVIGFATGAMFVREVFSGDFKVEAEKMVDMVRNAFKKNLKNLSWMDEDTRLAAETKADAISKMIGFPDYILEPNDLDKKYQGLEFREDEYFNNIVQVNKFNLLTNLKKLNEPVSKTRWTMTPATVNAFYTPTKNQIAIPAGILQPPFYDTLHQGALNFGAMGVIMGHELTHAFDDQGREYDSVGNLHKLWNNETIERFKERSVCLAKQYAEYKVYNKNINGNLTLGENIADNGGLKAAFHAYEEWSSQNQWEPILPALNLTRAQLFFVGFAQVWCSASTQETAKLQLEKDTHAPSRYRVMIPLSNLPDFSREFKCPEGSRMNPTNKCEVW